MINEKAIKKLLDEKLEGTDMFPVEISVKSGNRIFVFLDGDHDVSIDDCIDISRYIEHRLDRDQEDFELNVSSCGIDRPFQDIRQYRKYIGRNIIVKYPDNKKMEGTLREVDDQGITIAPVRKGKNKKNTPMEPIRLGFDEFREAKGAVSFK